MLELHGHLFSSYTWKALIALYANGTEFVFREIDQTVTKFESFTGKARPYRPYFPYGAPDRD
ncbi:hypothetical protein LY632_11560 [Erythrobacter sp. SDW2]|uniref:glutathione S-transferase N-terminal domain-containing protein n=1 Tax=Erythrobacter sp. SDW2 TaxID=2907154 RepID=UPI001F3AD6F1|nr:glutathione S-transferase N-terminal domain-containing protein [Erythrobacter sp. SDW2]UIP06321.1 hypothetical protein LY632_11560 [Erythrobacter sp. SDW2]